MSLLNPWVILSIVMALAGSYFGGHHKGYAEAEAEQQAEIARLNAQAREIEQAMTSKVVNISSKLQEASANAKVEIVKRDAAIADGTLRLSIATKSPVCPSADAPATGANNPPRAELDPTFAKSLVAITDDGDEAIRKLNACIDSYNTVYKIMRIVQ
jgi:prophage endopeptidase